MGFNQGHATFGIGHNPNNAGGVLSGIQSINNATGPAVTFKEGSGILLIDRVGNNIYINASGTSINGLDSAIWSYVSGILVSGLIPNDLNLAKGVRAGSGIELIDLGSLVIINASGSTGSGPVDLTASGFATYTSLYASGYVRNVDLLTSGYVISINGLKNNLTIVGSGGTNIWTDGQTIQIAAPAASGGGLTSINAATGPAILLREQIGSGIEIQTSGNSIFFGLKPIDLTASGFATYSQLHTSGYIKNSDFVQSGFIKKSEVAASGFLTRTELQVSGYTTLTEVRNDVRTSGYELHSDILASGYLKRSDLIGSGYVVNVNGLQNAISIVGSGGTTIWVDGQTIQISAPSASGGGITSINAASGPAVLLREQIGSGVEILTSGNSIFFGLKPIDLTASGFATISQLQTSGYTTLSEVHSDMHASGYIRNATFVTSGFITKAEVAASGFATRSELVTSGYTTLSEVRNDVRTSGYELHSDVLASGYVRNTDLLASGYVRSINGLKNTPTIVGSGNVQVWVDGQNIEIGTTAATLAEVQSNLHTSGYIRNTNFVQSGFITKTEVASSGFLTRTELQTSGYTTLSEVRTDIRASGYESHADILTSGYLKRSDIIGSGYVTSINGLKNAVTIVGSGGATVWVDAQTIQVAASGGGASHTFSSGVTYMGTVYLTAASGQYTPSGSITIIRVKMLAAGGGGGGVTTASSTAAAGGGGGGGCYGEKEFTVGASGYTYLQAATGGAGGADTGATGTNGGNSSFTDNADAAIYLDCNGGEGGAGQTATGGVGTITAGGLGGAVGSQGDIFGPGEHGHIGMKLNTTVGAGGMGANTLWGAGGQSRTTAGVGVNAINYGGGGGGALQLNNSGAAAGGNGGPGIILVEQYGPA